MTAKDALYTILVIHIGLLNYHDYGSGKYRWWLKVKAICYGTESETTLMFDSESDALNVCKGYMFLA